MTLEHNITTKTKSITTTTLWSKVYPLLMTHQLNQ